MLQQQVIFASGGLSLFWGLVLTQQFGCEDNSYLIIIFSFKDTVQEDATHVSF